MSPHPGGHLGEPLACEAAGNTVAPRHSGDIPVAGVRRVPVLRWRDRCLHELDDWVSEEVPVALEFNGVSHAVMLATPCDLEDFALGFGISEGIFASAADLYGCEVVQSSLGTTVCMEVSSRSFNALKHRRRTLAGRTGCGVCGVWRAWHRWFVQCLRSCQADSFRHKPLCRPCGQCVPSKT